MVSKYKDQGVRKPVTAKDMHESLGGGVLVGRGSGELWATLTEESPTLSEERMSEEQQDQRISVKEAVQIAGDVMRDLYENLTLSDLLLEEVRRGNGDTWLITMSFSRPGRGGSGIVGFMSPGRAFKQVRIDAKTGDFLGMEIRTLPKPPEQESASGYVPR